MSKTYQFFVFCICLLCVGCKTISTCSVKIDTEMPYRDIKTLAVMHFDDKLLQEEAVTGFLLKQVANPDAGEILAEIMSEELSKNGKYQVLTRAEIKNKLKEKDVREEEMVKWRGYAALRKILEVDAVVIGKIDKFGLANMTVYERGNVSFTAECVDTANGKVLWSVAADESAAYKDEVELASKVVRETVEKLKEEVD